MNELSGQPNKPLKQTFFERVEKECVCPRSRLFFKSREVAVWFLWFLSVLVGALAVAVSEFVLQFHQYALYEATHENFLTFFVEALPYLWIITFGVMAGVAVYNLRHTKRGYRYPVAIIIASSVLLSVSGGTVLHWLGLGYQLDERLGQYLSLYTSQRKFELRLWQAPEFGRLVGRQVHTTLASTTIIFEDVTGTRWVMDIAELRPRDLELLASKEPVRLIGLPHSEDQHTFHACGAVPMFWGRNMPPNEMGHERGEFLARMHERATSAVKQPMPMSAPAPAPVESVGVTETTVISQNCAELPLMHRLPPPALH